MTNEIRDEARPHLRSILREGDPAADGREPTAEETARLRSRVVAAAREGEPAHAPAWRWRPAAVAAALLAVAALGAVLYQVRPAAGPAVESQEPGTAGLHDDTEPPRQIQFTTPGGTRVVWMLYPEDNDSDRRAARRPGGRS